MACFFFFKMDNMYVDFFWGGPMGFCTSFWRCLTSGHLHTRFFPRSFVSRSPHGWILYRRLEANENPNDPCFEGVDLKINLRSFGAL